MIIHGLNKTTLLDYPGHLACTLFTGGCNMRCLFCQNSGLVLNPSSEPLISEEYFFDFLDRRRHILQGVCISGGEPTLAPDLPEFLERIRSYDLLVKLDTNGLKPEVISLLLKNKMLDMISMDFKGPLDKYSLITGIANIDTDAISESVGLLLGCGIDYEFRTTVYSGMFREKDLRDIGSVLRGAKAYYLQAYRDSDMVLYKSLPDSIRAGIFSRKSDSDDVNYLREPEIKELKSYVKIIREYIPNTHVRGADL